jgi:hypothetical protein
MRPIGADGCAQLREHADPRFSSPARFAPARAGSYLFVKEEKTMTTDALRRIAMRLLHPISKPAGICLELMSNEDLDHWLEDHEA